MGKTAGRSEQCGEKTNKPALTLTKPSHITAYRSGIRQRRPQSADVRRSFCEMALDSALPVIDLREAAGASRPALALRLSEALETAGFFYVEGIPGYDEQELLTHTRWFFDLPESVKMGIARACFNPSTPYQYRGFFPVDKTSASHKEGYELGSPNPLTEPERNAGNMFYEATPWPDVPADPDQLRRFKEFSSRFYTTMTEAGLTLLRLAAEGCGVPADTLLGLFQPDPMSTLRYLHYPPRRGTVPAAARDPDDGALLVCSGHHDSGFLTLLSTFHYGGLQLRRPNGSWLSVPCRPGTVVVNIGEMLSTISRGRWKATYHRVIDGGCDRYSVPFFLEPKYSANLSFRLFDDDERPEQELRYGPWLLQKITRDFCEYSCLKVPQSLEV